MLLGQKTKNPKRAIVLICHCRGSGRVRAVVRKKRKKRMFLRRGGMIGDGFEKVICW